MRTKIIIAVVLSAVLSLTGCSGNGSESSNVPASVANSATSTSSKTDSTSSKTNSTSSKTDGTSSKTDGTSSKTDDTSSKTDGTSSKTDDTSSKTDDTSSTSSSSTSAAESKPAETNPVQVDWSAVPEIDEKDIQYTIHKAGKVNFDNVPKEEREKLKDGCVAIKKYTGDAEYIKIPQTIAGMSNIAVVGVDWGKNAKAIKFPDGISFSVYNAGTGTAPNVTSISLPDTVEYIQGFSGLKAIEEITLPKDLKTVGKTTFFRLENLKKVTFGEKVEVINVSAFSGCSGLEKITLPDSVSSIGSAAFNGCTNVEISFKGKTYDEKNVEELYGKDLSTM